MAFMLDQCHNIEEKVPAEIRSVMNVQEATAKALLVDCDALRAAQLEGDVMGANSVLMDAFSSDVRPLLAELARTWAWTPIRLPLMPVRATPSRSRAERAGGASGRLGQLSRR